MQPRVEWFSDDVDGVEYLNVGLQFERDGNEVRCILGAFQGEIGQEAMVIITGLVEQACMYTLGLDGETIEEAREAADKAERVATLTDIGGGAALG